MYRKQKIQRIIVMIIMITRAGMTQGWRSGERILLPPLWLGSDYQTWRHMWVEFVGSLLCFERVFSGYSSFPLLKNQPTILYELI